MYYKLKTSFLEDTLNDVFDDDGFNVLEISQSQSELATNDESSKMSSSIAALVGGATSSIILDELKANKDVKGTLCKGVAYANFEDKVVKEFDAVEVCELNEKARGPVQNIQKSKTENEVKRSLSEPNALKKSFTSSLCAKLLKASSFSKRNPRKSLSHVNSDTCTSISRQESLCSTRGQSEVLPDLETILVQKAKEQQTLTAVTGNPFLAGENTSVRNVFFYHTHSFQITQSIIVAINLMFTAETNTCLTDSSLCFFHC